MPEPVARVRTGVLVGREEDGFAEFLGVPFAQAPRGRANFEPPVALPGSDERVPCLDYGASAPRTNVSAGLIPEPVCVGANYLNLNIWTPALGKGQRLPVLVWIHGGGFTGGSNASPWYHGGRFARDGVVTVAVNYRLGAEGFLLLENEETNRGLLDMVMALTWVSENIAAFGGDPAQVTIAGQSAGASSCLALLTSHAARGLFRRVAAMSSGGMVAASQEEAGRLAADFAASSGVRLTAEALASLPRDRRAEVDKRYMPSGIGRRPLWEGTADEPAFGRETLVWRPVVDGALIEDAALTRAQRGALNGEALLIGTTSEEFTGRVAEGSGDLSEAAVHDALLVLGLGEAGAAAYLAHGRSRGSAAWALGQAFTDWRFRLPGLAMADAAAAAGLEVYTYDFRWASRVPAPGIRTACHSSDIPFVFDNLSAESVAAGVGEDAPQELADEIHAAWVTFVQGGKGPWPRYDADEHATMAFDGGSRLRRDVGSSLGVIWGAPSPGDPSGGAISGGTLSPGAPSGGAIPGGTLSGSAV